jgi:mannonate dehydratase
VRIWFFPIILFADIKDEPDHAEERPMNRRVWLQTAMAGAGTISLPSWLETTMADDNAVAPAFETVVRGAPPLRITDVRAILTAPAGIRLVVVKVETNEPGLYGLGCATFTQRARAVETAVNTFLKPFLVGRDATRIDDVWQSAFVSSYWRNGPVLGNALSGVDMALWDILGKRAGMPVYQLLGGKCREAVDTYRHASGADFTQLTDRVRQFIEEGYRNVRIQVDVPGFSTYGANGTASAENKLPENLRVDVWEPAPYARLVPRLFEHVRKALGDDVELLHDIHERVPPILAVQIVKDVEKFRPFFMEDPFSPEDVGYFKNLRQQTSTPIAMGELFNNPNEYVPLISERLIDFIRPYFADRRADSGPQTGRAVRVLRRAHRLARPGRRLSGRARLQHSSRPGRAEFRNSGGAAVHAGRAGCLSRLSDPEERVLLRQRQTGLRNGSERTTGGKISGRRRSAVRSALGNLAAARRNDRQAVSRSAGAAGPSSKIR